MRRIGRIAVRLCAMLLTALMLTGCWSGHELDELAIVMGVAFDKDEQEGAVEMTAQIVKTGEIRSSTGAIMNAEEKAYWNVTKSGEDVFELFREFTMQISRRIYSPHNLVIIWSEEVAREGVEDYIDIFLRDHENRLNEWVFVARGSGREVLEVEPNLESIPALKIANLLEQYSATSETAPVKLIDFLRAYTNETCAPIMPILNISDMEGEQIVSIDGTAVFDEGKMVGELNAEETRGVLWVRGAVKGGIIPVGMPNGKVEVEISSTSTVSDVEILEDGTIEVSLKIVQNGVAATQTGTDDLSDEEVLEILEKGTAEEINKEIQGAIAKGYEYGTDIFGFGIAVYRKYPQKWEEIKDNWSQELPKVVVKTTVECNITGSGRILKSLKADKE